MALIIIIGKKKTPKGDSAECLYIGYDGQKGHEASEKAADSETYDFIGRVVSPPLSPLRVEKNPAPAVKKTEPTKTVESIN